MTTKPDVESAARFLRSEGRLLERRLHHALFDDGPANAVVDVLRGYRNPDGGFGHGLEPDARSLHSQPLDAQIAFEALDAVGIAAPDLVGGACDWLATVGPGVPVLLANVTEGPHAPHWAGWDPPSGGDLNPTAALAGLLWRFGFEHPWREAATAYCWQQLAGGIPRNAHTIWPVLTFLEAAPEERPVRPLVDDLRDHLADVEWLHLDPSAEGYSYTPLDLAPSPDRLGATLFEPDLLEAFLDGLVATQQPDGGWEIAWDTLGPAAHADGRSVVTLHALRTLRAYGRC